MLTALLAALTGALAVGLFRQLALARHWLAVPTLRGLHERPTPSGAGAALFLTLALLALLAPWWQPGAYRPLVAGACLLAAVGFVDDLRPLAALPRLLLYAAAALYAAAWASAAASPALLFGLAVAILAFTNFFNFMDGTDGLAASQCVLAAGIVGALGAAGATSPAYAGLCLTLAGLHAGLLPFNAPRASVFMGDAGSVPTGFLLAALAVAGTLREGLPPALWLLLGAVFVCDAGTTLLFRLWRGAALAAAHREHLYQRLARRWRSHGRVLLLFWGLQLGWLTPLAVLSWLRPPLAPLLLLLGYGSLIITMVKLRGLQ